MNFDKLQEIGDQELARHEQYKRRLEVFKMMMVDRKS